MRIRRRNFLLPSEVRVVGLKDCSLNGLCGQIVGVRASESLICTALFSPQVLADLPGLANHLVHDAFPEAFDWLVMDLILKTGQEVGKMIG